MIIWWIREIAEERDEGRSSPNYVTQEEEQKDRKAKVIITDFPCACIPLLHHIK